MLEWFTKEGRQARLQRKIAKHCRAYRKASSIWKQDRAVHRLLNLGSDSALDALLCLAEKDLDRDRDISLIMGALKEKPNPKALPLLQKAFDHYCAQLTEKRKIPKEVKKAYREGRQGMDSLEFMRFASPLVRHMGLAEDAAEAIKACGGKAPRVPKPELFA